MIELLLLAVVVSTAYLGPLVMRRFGPAQRAFGWMLIANLVVAILGLIARSQGNAGEAGELLVVVALGAGFCLLVLPAVLRDLGRRFMAADWLRLARALTGLREHLQPGMGARVEVELIDTILAVREGREQEIIDALLERRDSSDEPLMRQAIDERVIMTYLYAQRWEDAAAHYDRLTERGRRPGSPQLNVDMVRAYCESGDIDKAAELMQLIEDSPLATRAALESLLARARMIFLAFVGRTGAVEAIVGPGGPLAEMPVAARRFWSGLARLNAGDLSGARSSLEEAARLSKDDPKAHDLARATLARVGEPGQAGPHAVSIEVAELADRLASTTIEQRQAPAREELSDPLPILGRVPWSSIPITVSTTALMLLAPVFVYLRYGSFTDVGAYLAAGANVKSVTLAGDWWRLVSALFLHTGLAQLALSVYALWLVSRVAEQMFGHRRTFVILLLSGVAGGVVSSFAGLSPSTMGSQAAMMGLIGAVGVELFVHRSVYRPGRVRPLLTGIAVLVLIDLALGFFYPLIDHMGYLGGLGAGVVLGVVLSRRGAFLAKGRDALAWLLALAALGTLGYAGYARATTDLGERLQQQPHSWRELGGLRVHVPDSFRAESEGELYDPGFNMELVLHRLDTEVGLDEAIAKRIDFERHGGALRAGFDRARPSARSHLNLPSPWRSQELELSVDHGAGAQNFRFVVFGRVAGDEIWLGAFNHPSALSDAIEGVLGDALQSLAPVAGASPATGFGELDELAPSPPPLP